MPFFVVSLDQIELVYLERVSFGLKNFDLVLVMKDYTKPVVTISAIPVFQLDLIKDWLTETELKYFEGITNLVWNNIMKTIRDDPDWDPWGPEGWNSILSNDDEDEAQGEDPDGEDEEYNDEEDEEDEDDEKIASDGDDDDDEFESDEESDDGGEFAGENELSEDELGEDWEELEEDVKNEILTFFRLSIMTRREI
jgi:nucleosome binding factor SPN SPT16 subunit